jgi:hypothetical protein
VLRLDDKAQACTDEKEQTHIDEKDQARLDEKTQTHIDEKAQARLDEKTQTHIDMKSADGVHVQEETGKEETKSHIKENPDGIDGDRQRARQIISRLLAAKVIPDFKSLVWFGLSVDALIVNGVKQPELLHQQLVNDFNIKEGYGLYYGSVQVTGRGVFLNKDDLEQ